jgi:hypothetical protein
MTTLSWAELREEHSGLTQFYDPRQPRDAGGQWSSHGGGGHGGGGGATKGWKRTSTPAARATHRKAKVEELVGKFGEGFRKSAEGMTGWMTEFTPAEADDRRRRLSEFTSEAYGKTDTQSFNSVSKDGRLAPGEYTPERLAAHDRLIADYKKDVNWDSIPAERQALLSGGLGGAGKGTMLKKMNIDHEKFVTIDPDSLKGYMSKHGLVPDPVSLGLKDFDPPVRPMELAGLIHEESSDLSKRIANMAMDEGRNVILDNTMGSDSVFKKVNELKDRGYGVEGVFVDVSIDMSVESALARHMNGTVEGGDGGRFVDPKLAAGQEPKDPQYRSANRERFNKIAPQLKKATVIDNQAYAQRPTAFSESTWAGFSPAAKSYVMRNIREKSISELLSHARTL